MNDAILLIIGLVIEICCIGLVKKIVNNNIIAVVVGLGLGFFFYWIFLGRYYASLY